MRISSAPTIIDGPVAKTIPTRNVEINGDGSVTVKYEFSSVWTYDDSLYSQNVMIDIDGFGRNTQAGQAGWPERIDRINVPSGKEATVSVLNSSFKTYNIKLSPARALLIDSSDGGHTLENVPPVIIG